MTAGKTGRHHRHTKLKRPVSRMAGTRVVIDPQGWEKLKLRVSQLVQQLTDDVYFDMIRFAPVDTGELLGSIKTSYPGWNRGRIKVGTDHWFYVEFGTRYMRAEPYIRPAVYRYRHGVTL